MVDAVAAINGKRRINTHCSGCHFFLCITYSIKTYIRHSETNQTFSGMVMLHQHIQFYDLKCGGGGFVLAYQDFGGRLWMNQSTPALFLSLVE